MPTILGANTLSTGYEVANSLRFNDGSSDSLTMTPSGSPTNADKNTLSMWVKLGVLGINRSPIFANSNAGGVNFRTDDKIDFYNAGGSLRTTQTFTDPSAWYHLVFTTDTTDGTADDRLKIYVNGVQITSFASRSNPSQNTNSNLGSANEHRIGANNDPANFFDGYMAEVVFIDGQALDPTSFGEFDSDSPTIWKPKNVSGLTFGTNGFYLDFEDSSSLGNDVAGSNNFAVNNLTSIDQSTDTCTNNFATLNPLIPESSSNTFSEGNLKVTGGGSDSWTTHYGVSTFAVSQGKWYVESKVTTTQTSQAILGIISTSQPINSSLKDTGRATVEKEGRITVFGSNAQTGLTAFSNGDIAAIAFDATNGTAQFYRNGSAYGSAVSSIPSDLYYFATTTYESGGVVEFNFGAPAFSISSGNSDQNGYGNFEYSVPSGYYALNSKNLAEFG
jgi:hypothetical protein